MQQYLQCFSIQQARITVPKTIQESRLEVAGGHGERVGALLLILCCTPQTQRTAVLRLSVSSDPVLLPPSDDQTAKGLGWVSP